MVGGTRHPPLPHPTVNRTRAANGRDLQTSTVATDDLWAPTFSPAAESLPKKTPLHGPSYFLPRRTLCRLQLLFFLFSSLLRRDRLRTTLLSTRTGGFLLMSLFAALRTLARNPAPVQSGESGLPSCARARPDISNTSAPRVVQSH